MPRLNDPSIGRENLIFSHPKHICYLFTNNSKKDWYVSGDQGLGGDMKDVQWSITRDLLTQSHPELRLIHLIPKQELQYLERSFLYIERTDSDGNFIDATPCSDVLAALLAVGIKAYRMYITKGDQKWHRLSVDLKLNPKMLSR